MTNLIPLHYRGVANSWIRLTGSCAYCIAESDELDRSSWPTTKRKEEIGALADGFLASALLHRQEKLDHPSLELL